MTPAYGIKHWWRSSLEKSEGASLKQFARRYRHHRTGEGTTNVWFERKRQHRKGKRK